MEPREPVPACPIFAELVPYYTRWLNHEQLASADFDRIAAHLQGCSACQCFIQSRQTDPARLESLQIKPPAQGSRQWPGAAGPIETPTRIAPATQPQAGPPAYYVAPAVAEAVLTPEMQTGYNLLDAPQSHFGSYRIVGRVGTGGMGMVFEAVDPQLNRRVALKVLRPEFATNSTERLRFLEEARAAAAVPHENIVAIYHVGQQSDVPFLVMQFLDGESLEACLEREQRLPCAQALRITREVAEGLDAAHVRGLIHRDIKPANIWLESAGPGQALRRVKILDFGLVRDNSRSSLTEPGTVMGTPAYMSPEQARGDPVDHRCDLFSLGAMLYRILCGEPPFGCGNPMLVLTALATAEPQPLEQRVPDLPPALARLVGQLLAKDRDSRPSATRDVVNYLQKLEQDVEPPPLRCLAPQGDTPPGSGQHKPAAQPWGWGAALLALAKAIARWMRPPDGAKPAVPTGEPIKVGVLHSMSGTMAGSELAVVDATLLAIDELNQQGGVLGRPVQAVVCDGKSDWPTFAALADQLITKDRVCTVFGCWTSASRKTVRPIFERRDHLLIYPLQYEGLEQSPNIVYVGASPNQQIVPSVRFAIGFLRKRRLFLVGSDYVFPRSAHAIIRDMLAGERDIEIVGEHYLALGDTEVGPVIQAILQSQPDMILNTINGDSNIAFFRALRAAGITPAKVPTLSFSIAESELRTFNDRDVVGDYAAWTYFQSVDRPENRAFVARFQARYGPQRVVSDPMEAAYTGVHLWAKAVAAAGKTDVTAIREAMKGQSFNAPSGNVRIDPTNQHTWKIVRVGHIIAGGQFALDWSSENPIRPEPFPETRSPGDWEKFLADLCRGWDGQWENPKRAGS